MKRTELLWCGALALAVGCGTGAKKGGSSDDPTQQQQQQQQQQQGYDLSTEVHGLDASGELHADNVTLNFGVAGQDVARDNLKLEGYECRFAETSKWVPCSATPLSIGSLRDGDTLDIGVRAVMRDTTANVVFYAKEAQVHVKVVLTDVPVIGQTPLPPDVNAVRAIGTKLQIGNAYQLQVPVGMHVTEYSTSKTTGVLSFFRILPESDPYYLGNHGCVREWDRVVAGASPAGEPLMYCHSTPTRDAYKAEGESRLANNHVEIATDTKLVKKEGQERISMSVYDADYELSARRSRFSSVCQNAAKTYVTAPMIPDFFLGKNPEKVDFYICDVYLPDMNGEAVQWRVGAFYDIDHMDWACPDCKYSRAVEVVYMSRVNADNHLDANFAKIAQTQILAHLSKLTP